MTLYANYSYQPNTSNLKLWISSNLDTLTLNTTTSSLNWGIYDMLVTILKCHPNCKTCTGPLETQCTACNDLKRELKDGACKCNITAGYYEQNTNCQTNCNTNYYKDKITAKCVLVG